MTAEINKAVERLSERIHRHTDKSQPNIVAGDIRALLSELSRLREENAALTRELDDLKSQLLEAHRLWDADRIILSRQSKEGGE